MSKRKVVKKVVKDDGEEVEELVDEPLDEEDSTGTLVHGGLTAEEKADQDAKAAEKALAEETAIKTAVAAAVEKLRTPSSHLNDLQHRMDAGFEVTRQHLGDVKTRIDEAVKDLLASLGL